jgi:sporulation protein YqfC
MKYKRTIEALERAADYFDLPSQVAAGSTMVTITGRRLVRIENHRGVECLEDDVVIVKTGAGHVCVKGSALTLTAMNRREMLISGCVSGVELEE